MAAGSPAAGSNPPVSEAAVGARCSRLRLLPTSPLRPRSPAAPPSRPTPLRDGAATPLPEANRDRHLRKASSRARVPNLGLQVKRHKTLVSYFAPASASGRQVNQNQPPQDSQGQARGETGASNVAEQQDSHALDPEPEDIITSPAQETVETRSTNANVEQQNSDGVHVQQTNLARPGDTRWGSHHKTLCRLLHMWDSVLEVLENVAEDGIGEKRSTASGLLKQMESAEFVLILHLMISLLGKTNDLSQCLQRKDQNIVRAVGLIGTTLEILNDTREHGWEDLFDDVKNFCVQHRIIIPNMEDTITVRGRSRGRGGQEVTYYHHLKHEIFNVVHDQIIVELNNRFAERSTQLLRCIACLDPRNSFANFNKDKLIELAQIYADDFSQYDCVLLRDQLGNFIGEVRTDPNFTSCTDLGNLAVKMVQTDRHEAFPLVYRLMELALILPVATATVERAFSAMNIIKTELRSKMGNEWLNHRMVCYIERGVFASIKDDDILLHFQELKSRREHLPKQLPASGPVNIVDEHTEPRMN